MSVQLEVYLVITLGYESSSEKKIFKNIFENGWLMKYGERTVYFPAANIDKSDWLEKRISVIDFQKRIKKSKEPIVVSLHWKETDIDISMQIFPSHESLDLLSSITRLKFNLPDKVNITEVT